MMRRNSELGSAALKVGRRMGSHVFVLMHESRMRGRERQRQGWCRIGHVVNVVEGLCIVVQET